MAHQILVVDDEPHIRDVIGFTLERAGMGVAFARNGVEALARLKRSIFDLVVLDIGMPEMDGLEVCRTIRRISDVPILFLSARDEEIDRVLGLELGGDDYVTKPFSPRELTARVNVILKRVKGPPAARTQVMVHGAVRLDCGAHTVESGGISIALTALEFSILNALMARPTLVLSRTQLMDAAYGPSIHVADRTIDSHIRNVRAKFTLAGQPPPIETVHGVGFRLVAVEPAQ